TLVQAFQYWVKMFAISAPVFVLMAVFGGYGSHLKANFTAPEMQNPPAWVEAGAPPVKREALPESVPAGIAKPPVDDEWISPFGRMTSRAAVNARAAGVEIEDTRPYALLYTY